jgi:hypothetical protein
MNPEIVRRSKTRLHGVASVSFDGMHFEYRPEFLALRRSSRNEAGHLIPTVRRPFNVIAGGNQPEPSASQIATAPEPPMTQEAVQNLPAL